MVDSHDKDADIGQPGGHDPEEMLGVSVGGLVAAVQIDQNDRRPCDGGEGADEGRQEAFSLCAEVGREADEYPAQYEVESVFHQVWHGRFLILMSAGG